MKGFLIGLIASTSLMVILMYTTVINPLAFTNLFGVQASPQENTESTETDANDLKTTQKETNPIASYTTHIQKGDVLFEKGQYTLAEKEFRTALELEPTLAEAFYKLGQTLLELEDFEQAKTHFESSNSKAPEVLYYQGVLKDYNGDHEGARKIFQQVVEMDSDGQWAKKALTYLNSFKEFEQAQDASPEYIKTLIARSFAETGEYTLAINTLYEVLKVENDYRDAWIILGYSYVQEKKYNEAQEALFKAVELDPTQAEARYFLGLSYFGLRDFKSTIPQMELALESDLEDPLDAYEKIADSAVEIKDYTKALEAYEKVLILDSSDIDRFIRPVWLSIDHLNNPKKALELGKKAAEKHPNSAMAHNLLGWGHLANADLENAEESLNYALILDSDLAAAYLNFGQLYEKKQDIDKAMEYYKRAYTLDPNDSIGKKAAESYNKLINNNQAPTVQTNPPAMRD